jgi:lipopolysaccharide biosynthesis regulator YciM
MSKNFIVKSSGVYGTKKKKTLKEICTKPGGEVNKSTFNAIQQLKSKLYPSTPKSNQQTAQNNSLIISSSSGTGSVIIQPTGNIANSGTGSSNISNTARRAQQAQQQIGQSVTPAQAVQIMLNTSKAMKSLNSSKSDDNMSISELIEKLRNHNITLGNSNEGLQILSTIKKIEENLKELKILVDVE